MMVANSHIQCARLVIAPFLFRVPSTRLSADGGRNEFGRDGEPLSLGEAEEAIMMANACGEFVDP